MWLKSPQTEKKRKTFLTHSHGNKKPPESVLKVLINAHQPYSPTNFSSFLLKESQEGTKSLQNTCLGVPTNQQQSYPNNHGASDDEKPFNSLKVPQSLKSTLPQTLYKKIRLLC